ncbi:MAG: putative toxin-antitoxin system toxin component, PIN family [Selenomonadaceae bacterium]|nr:putative toxin-antitoxin system toxin component, PIN family [Selenomonadaceae bacterium]
MRVMIDTNILISAILGDGTPYRAYIKAVSYPNQGIVCIQNFDELRRIFNKKLPKKIASMERFLSMALPSLEIVEIPEKEVPEEQLIRDLNDRAIMRAAVTSKVDILLTGDKDFLESGIEKPQIMTAREFVDGTTGIP